MPVVAMSYMNVQGDVGGTGISRFHWRRTDNTTPVGSDCNSAAAAIYDLFHTVQAELPADIQWVPGSIVQLFDVNSGLIQGSLPVTTTGSNVSGTSTGNYAAGVGARINWQTSTVHGRRFIRGTTYIVPGGPNMYASNGNISASSGSAVSTGAAAYVNAMLTAGLTPVIWGRPPKGLTTGGHMGDITAYVVPLTPAGLRSRRS